KKAYARLPAPVRVHNLYGPTEAAVDVTYWPCPRGEDFHRVPIGRPVANTVLYVLDVHGQPAPVGIPGELHIGGVQVGRGYWQRPQLTAERFIPDAFSGIPGARLYRTGDVARWLPDGTLEYLGRADFQVKLRGFRIELGEIEAALAADPAVHDSVVLAREDSTGDQRLVAYVVLDDAAAAQEVDASSQWQAIYDEAYARETTESEDPTFNIVGWEDSYTGESLPPAQMREWVDTTVAQILSFQPKRVLELGCGTGLLLYRLAPRCEAYWGVDFARPALDRIERQRERMGGALDSVHLLHQSVDDFSALEPGSFDTVVINSVVQYFSSPEFLLDVLRGAVRVLKPGGRVFLGDVRSLELLEAFRASVRLHRTAGPGATSQFAYRVQRDILAEKELVLSPAFFTALPERIPGIQRVEVLPKHGRYDNELSRFRYEVILHVGDAARTPARRTKPDWVDGAGLTLDGLREQLSARPGLLAVRGLPNARVLEPTRLVELLSATPPPTVARLREALHDWSGPRGVEPEDLYVLGSELGYEVRVSWASAHRDGALDVVFAHPDEVGTLDLSPEPKQVTSWDGLASDPLRGARSAQAVSRLRDALADKLPPHMVPSAFVVLPALPLSPNGKVDRKALPAPEAERLGAADAFIAPRTPTEEKVARIFGEILGQSRVGANDDFFALGGHSLLATQVVVRVRAQLNTEISLRTLFDAPTVARLAERIESQVQLADAPGVPALVPLERGPSADEGLAASFAQQRLWFLEQLHPGQAAYNLPAALRLTGPLDVEALRRTFLEVVRRHEAVRTTFVTREGQPAQRIHPAPAEWPLPEEDLRGLEPIARDAAVQARMAEEAHRAFDLEKGPLLRTVLLRTGADAHVLLLCMHHIVSDGWSMGVLVREVAALYEALSQGHEAALPALSVQYADYAAWQRRVLEGPALAPQLDWWRSRLEGAPTLELPTDHARPAVRTLRGATHAFTMPPSLVAGLERVGQEQGATLFMVLMAGWQALLARYSGQTDFCVGTPLAHRTRPELEGLIGFFVNTLALRANVDGDPRFDDLVARVREESLAAFANQDVPFDRLVEALGGQRDLSRTPLFQAAFVLQNAPMQPPTLPGMVVDVLRTGTDTARFDVTLLLVERGGRLEGELEYSLDLFTPDAARRMVEHFQRLLRGVSADAARRISAVPLWSEAERDEVLVAWNDTAAPYPADTTVHQRFMEQARRTPERVAVTFEGRSLTYAELDARSNQLARHLVSLGLELEARIGVCGSRGLELVIGVLGALKAGGCYVPLDPSWPMKRLEHVSSAARLSAVLTWQSLLPSLKDGPWHVVALDADAADIARQSTEAVPVPVLPDALAFATFTSGSTGTPKGVAIPHRGLLRLSEGTRFLTQSPEEVTLQLSPLAFDVSSVELWGTLLHGGRLVVYPPGTPELDAVARLIIEHKVSWLLLPTSLFGLMQQHQPEALLRVPNLMVGGEALPAPRLRERLAQGGALTNAYGPTECSTMVTRYTLSPGDTVGLSVPIGRPIDNTEVYVLDPALCPVPVGVPGELCLGGPGLARGYLNRPDLTAECFVPHPFSAVPGARLYRTGDRVRWRPDGVLEFLGRLDHQVKVRGFRIELGEIEAVLRAHPFVAEATVVVREDGSGSNRLVAYVVPPQPDVAPLREYLHQHLPDYMLPSAFIGLDAFPLTPTGKVDRKALPAPDLGLGASDFVAPRTELEQQLAALFREALDIERVGLNDDFFLLGGHSLLATQVVTRLRARLGVELPLRTFFEAPTVARLAARLESAPRTGAWLPLEPVSRPASGEATFDVSSAQRRLWFMEQLHPGLAVNHIPAALRLTGRLDVEALRRTFLEVVRRHEAVRTTFVTRGGHPAQRIHPVPSEWPLPVEDLSGLEPIARDAAVQARMGEEAHRAFDLERGPLLRTVLLCTGPDAHVLLLCMHHIISDGWSMGVLVREVGALYEALAQGRESPLPALVVQYADYAAWQRRLLDDPALTPQLDWWRSRLEGAPTLELPTDHARPAVHGAKGATYFFSLPAEQVAGLERVALAHNATLYMVLMAGWQALLARYSGQTDFTVGTTVAARSRPELEGLIGVFVNPLALRCRLDGNPTFSELVTRVREESLGAFAHQEVPFEQLVDALGGERDLSRTPLFQTLFVLLSSDLLQAPSLPGLQIDVLPNATDTSRFDLTLSMMDRGGALDGQLEYSLELFTPDTARRMVEHLRVLLAAVADGAGAQRLSELPLMDAGERQQVLSTWNATQAAYPVDATVPSLFAAQALKTPHAVAVEHDGRTLTYAELDTRSNQLAHHLNALGLGAEARVGVFLHRGLDLLVGLLGILKAGCAYVPLDPEYPAQRLAFMAEDSGVAAILTEAALEDELPAGAQVVIVLDDEWTWIERQPSTPVTGGIVGPDQLAYITYTSGSTGTPKGVAIPHRGVVRLLIGSRFVDLGPSEVVLQLAPLAFDASTLEIWGALLHGARLVLYPQRTLDLAELGQALERHHVSVLWLTAALFDQMQQHQPEALRKVRQLLAGGDVLPAPRVRERLAQGVGLVNGYGPTESTTFTACHRMAAGDAVGDSVSIGRPIANTQVYVLDPAMRAAPVGVPGEVFIGGDGLARGYLGQPALTAERFVPNPFGPPGARLYRSGDRARWLADGTLQFLGRVDFQVKLRGFRIELGEIETALRSHSEVETAIALVREDSPGDRRLVAYVTPEDVDTASLREHLRQRLPEYMVPNAVVVLSTLPLSPNGKVDRKALPAPDLSPAEDTQTAALPLLQQQLATLFREVLRVERVRPQDDFFELGGHSLLATQLVTRVRAELGVEVPLRTLFEAPTLAGLAERIEALMMQASRASMPPLEPVPRNAALPLSFAQQRLWFLSQFQKGHAVYNVPFALKLFGPLDMDALRRTFAEVVSRHEVLRTSFPVTEGLPRQQVNPAPAVWDLPVEDLSAMVGPARDARVRQRMIAEAHFPFDLSTGPLFRSVLLRLDADAYVLLLCVHHIVSDGWSLGVLVREVSALYAAFSEGKPSPLPPLAVQYADFAAWQRQWVLHDGIQTQLTELRSHLQGVPALELIGDLSRPAVRTVRGSSQFFTVSPELVQSLEKVARDQGATLFMVLLAAYEVLVSRYSGQQDFCVGSPIAHRTQSELEPLIGFFVNTLALRARLEGAPTFAELVSRVREEALAAYVRQDVPFDRLVEAMGVERGGGKSPLIQVMFALQNSPMQLPALAGMRVEPLRSATETARLDLTLSMMDLGDGALEGALEYSTDLFTPEAAKRLIRHFQTLLEAIVRDPEMRIQSLPMLPEDEQHQVLKGFQGREMAPASEASIHALVEAQVARTPDAVAVAFESERLTYRELDARANQVAHHLRGLGVAPESLVGVCLERSVDMVVALLGVLKAGAAYVPVDPAYPKERLGWMLEDTGASVLLTHEKWKSVLPPSAARVVCLDSAAGEVAKQPVTKPSVQVGPQALAYVIFTSGSTGRPKGAMNAHGGVVNRLKWMQEEYGLSGTDVVLQKTPFSFDVSVWEFFWPLLAGAKLV
ncbi:amino acid adenylation domain-containing protein, partial [Myxococcus xanthus]